MRKFIYYISLIFFSFIISCEKNNEIITEVIDYSYFPLDTNTWIIYSVTIIEIDAAINKFDTTNFQLKEIIESSFNDNEGNESNRIERYVRENENQQWQLKDVWFATLYQTSAHKIEENIRYVKMIFPIEINKKWNGDLYNLNSNYASDYFYQSIDEPLVLNQINFDSVTTIIQSDNESLIDKLYSYEKYAKHIGLIDKLQIDVYSDEEDFSLDILDRITFGTIYKQEILDYGKD